MHQDTIVINQYISMHAFLSWIFSESQLITSKLQILDAALKLCFFGFPVSSLPRPYYLLRQDPQTRLVYTGG